MRRSLINIGVIYDMVTWESRVFYCGDTLDLVYDVMCVKGNAYPSETDKRIRSRTRLNHPA